MRVKINSGKGRFIPGIDRNGPVLQISRLLLSEQEQHWKEYGTKDRV